MIAMSNEKLDVEIVKKMRVSPIYFIEKIWKLKPQPVKEEFKDIINSLYQEGRESEIKAEYFETFIKGKHITWQQWLILLKVELAIKGKRKNRITVRSGHGIGKSVTFAWLIIWYLFCHKDAQVPVTAPTSEQMHDVLWKELSVWHKKMPIALQGLFEWSNGYLRVTERPESWFARAKTARKENPEALAGVHGDHVMFLADEASGIPDEIFNTAEGAMTGPKVIVVLISNPTRLIGYFRDSQKSDANNWEVLAFNSEDSPIVDKKYVDRILDKHGEDSDEYRIRVMGEFPKEDTVDDAGYVQMFIEEDIKLSKNKEFIGEILMGIDPAGEGNDETIWVIRDQFKSVIVAKEKTSTAKTIAQKTLTLMDLYNIRGENIYVDNFGEGANVAQELAMAGVRVNGINVGDKAYDPMFYNLRAEAYWKAKQALRTGHELVEHEGWKELLAIRYRKELNGRLKIMGKLEMKKTLGRSPDHADAWSLTFIRPARQHVERTLRRMKKHIPSTYKVKMA